MLADRSWRISKRLNDDLGKSHEGTMVTRYKNMNVNIRSQIYIALYRAPRT